MYSVLLVCWRYMGIQAMPKWSFLASRRQKMRYRRRSRMCSSINFTGTGHFGHLITMATISMTKNNYSAKMLLNQEFWKNKIKNSCYLLFCCLFLIRSAALVKVVCNKLWKCCLKTKCFTKILKTVNRS